MDESKLLAELERRFPSLGTDDENVDVCDQWDALVAWHAELVGPDYVPKPADCPVCGEFVGNSGVCPDGCGHYERGAVSLPLAAAQAAIALGLASGVASLMAWAQGLIGGVL